MQWSPNWLSKNQAWNKAWFQKPWQNTQPTWVPTPGGGWAKQYPPGQVGIPYAWYPGYGLVQ